MSRNSRARASVVVAIFLFLAAGVLYTEAMPPWEAPDEPWHLAYAEALAVEREPTHHDTYEAHQPPLYYALASFVLRVLDIKYIQRAPDNPWYPYAEAALWHVPGDPAVPPMRLLRTLSGFLGTLVVALAWATTRVTVPGTVLRPTLVAMFVALLPQFVFITHSVNNDVMAALAGAVLVYGFVVWVARQGPDGDRLVRASVVLVVGGAMVVVTKVNAAVLVLAAPLCTLLAERIDSAGTRHRATRPGRWRAAAAPLGGLVVGLAAGLAAMMVITPGVSRRVLTDATERGLTVSGTAADPDVFVRLLLLTSSSFVARFGWLNIDLPSAVYVLAAMATMVAAVGVVLRWRRASIAEQNALAVAAAVSALAIVATLKNLLADPQPQGRFLFPALSAAALLLATGWSHFAAPRWARMLVVAGGVALVLVNVFAATVLLPRSYAAASGPLPRIGTRVMPPRRHVVARLGGDIPTVTQSVRFSDPNVSSISVAVAYAKGPGNVEISLLDETGDLVFGSKYALGDVDGNRWLRLNIPNRYLCCPGEFDLVIGVDGPDALLGLWGSSEDVYPDGSLGGSGGDLALVVETGWSAVTPGP